jgi:hypothetical protein
MGYIRCIAFAFLFCACNKLQAQDYFVEEDSIGIEVYMSKCKGFSRAGINKCDRLSSKIRKATDEALSKFQDIEFNFLLQLCSVNERHAESLIQNSQYSINRLNSKIDREINQQISGYIPEFDSLNMAVRYISELIEKDSLSECECNELDKLRQRQAGLRDEIKRTELVVQYMDERTTYLNKLSLEYPELGMSMHPLQKLTYYFKASNNEFFSVFSDRTKPEKLIFSLLNRSNSFREYSNEFGQLAKYNVAINQQANEGQSMANVIEQLVLLAKSNKDNTPLLDQLNTHRIKDHDILNTNQPENLQNRKLGLDQISKEKAESSSKRTPQAETKKGWKPNPLKSKRFKDRLIYGLNFQGTQRREFLPTSGLITGSLSYRLNTKMNLGIGFSNNFGFNVIGHKSEILKPPIIEFKGYSYRAIYTFNIYRSCFLSFNYERNLQKAVLVNQNLRDYFLNDNSTPSALIGLKLKMNNSGRTSNTLEVLYDLLHERLSQPALVIRVGFEIIPKHGLK